MCCNGLRLFFIYIASGCLSTQRLALVFSFSTASVKTVYNKINKYLGVIRGNEGGDGIYAVSRRSENMKRKIGRQWNVTTLPFVGFLGFTFLFCSFFPSRYAVYCVHDGIEKYFRFSAYGRRKLSRRDIA